MSVVHLPPGGSARLVLGADFDSGGGDVLLLELDEALLEEALRCGLVLKGAPDEGAVLCGGGRTFSLRAVGTSNTLLLVPPPADGGAEFAPPAAPYETPGGAAGAETQAAALAACDAGAAVVARCRATSYLELVEVAPPLAWLRARLAARPYDDDAHDDAAAAAHPGGAAPGFGAGWAELAAEARCSDAQLRAALAGPSLGALFLRGRHALLSRPYAARALRDALLTAQANGWGPLFRTGMPAAVGDAGDGGDGDPAAQPPPPPAGLPRRALLDAMQADGYERGVASFVLDRFCDRDDGDGANAAAGGAPPDPSAAPPTIVSFCAAAVGRHAAGVLLDSRPRWRLDAFASAWAAALPPELRPPRLAWLAGEGLVMPSLAAAAAALAPPPLGPGGAAVHAGAAAACTVLRLRLDELPPDPVARFDALFAARPVWPGDEVGPWLAGVEQPGATPDALLLRHARCSQPRPGGPKAYSAR